MKHSLLLVAVVALVAFAAPAHSQYMWLDVDGNGICDTNDTLTPSSTSVDVWLSTNLNGDGSPAICAIEPSTNLTINSYEFFVRSTGSMTLGAWSDNMSYPTSFGDFQAGTDAYHGRAGAQQVEGTYKLGTLAISGVAAGATLSIVAASSVNPPGYTSFGTNCPGGEFDNTYKLGSDWNDVCGTASPTPVRATTWGNIKNIYR
jgi:hypothetical protein